MRIPFVSSYSLLSRPRVGRRTALALVLVGFCQTFGIGIRAETVVSHPYPGVTLATLHETSPRNFTARAVTIDLSTPGLRFRLTPPSGKLETLRQTTLEFARQEKAQLAINVHFFLPFPSGEPEANLIGLAASEGKIFSDFEIPAQNYALLANAPALNIDRTNHPSLIHPGDSRTDLWTTVSGSAQIVTSGKATVPVYRDEEHPSGQLTAGGPGKTPFSNKDSWYERQNARTAIGIADNGRNLVLFVVDRAAGSLGLTLPEVANLLISQFHVTDALNLDGGGSTTLVMEDPVTHEVTLANASSDNPKGRSVGSNLAAFLPVNQQ